jgi:enoyl-[acyl-carrier-protein] reductase (NADH)
VARVVLFCASDLSMFMTGSSLLVDAGELAR